MEKYINLKTFEISWDMPDYIPCDDEIAEAIAILNQKGYRTTASCAGHHRVFDKYVIPWSVEEKDELIKNQHKFYVVSEDEKYIWCVPKRLTDATYVAFAEKHNFDSLPKGFEYREYKDNEYYRCAIECLNEMYEDEEGKIRKSEDEIINHLKEAQASLLEWAKSLKKLNEIKKGK